MQFHWSLTPLSLVVAVAERTLTLTSNLLMVEAGMLLLSLFYDAC